MLNRRLLDEMPYYDYQHSRYLLDRSLFGTTEDTNLEKRVSECYDAFVTAIRERSLSPDDDICPMYNYNCKRVLCANYGPGLQLLAEEIALSFISRPEWNDFAIELAPCDEEMILDGRQELVTLNEIVVQAKPKKK